VSRWPEVAIGEVAYPVDRSEQPVPGVTYRRIGVRLWGEGAYEREPIDGAETKYKTLNRVETGDIIVNKIWARNGSVSVVSDELDGCFCSGEFPLFRPVVDKLDPHWFYWITKARWFWERCEEQSRGTSGKNRLRPQKFLQIAIPLPPVEEQRRVAEKLNRLAAAQWKAVALRGRCDDELQAMRRSLMTQAFRDCGPLRTIESVCLAVVDNLHSTPHYLGDAYPCIRSQDVGWGSINYATALRTDQSEFLERTRRGEPVAGDIVFVREGDVGRCGLVDGSQRFSLGQRVMMLRPNPDVVIPRFLMMQLMAPPVLDEQLLEGVTGTTSRHLNIKVVRSARVAVPSLKRQQAILVRTDYIFGCLERVQERCSDQAKALDSLLPSALSRWLGQLDSRLPYATRRAAVDVARGPWTGGG